MYRKSYQEYVMDTSLSLNEIRQRLEDYEAEDKYNKKLEDDDPYESVSILGFHDD